MGMSESSVPRPSAGDWSDALLTSNTEALLGAVRNYIGPVKTPYDKRDLVGKLETFLHRAETRASLLSLLDSLDIKILGTSLLVGPVPEQTLKELFSGELALFELGIRVSNLLDRLLLFRYQFSGRRLIAVNPLFADDLRSRTLDPAELFAIERHAEEGDGGKGGTGGKGTELADEMTGLGELRSVPEKTYPRIDGQTIIALFSFLFHTPFATRKGGGLTKRAAERAAALFPELFAAGRGRGDSLARALMASRALSANEGEDRLPDRLNFAAMVEEWGEDLPLLLAASLAAEGDGDRAQDLALPGEGSGDSPYADGTLARSLAVVLAGACEALPHDLVFSKAGLSRWLRIVAKAAHLEIDPAVALPALEELGVLAPSERGLTIVMAGWNMAVRRTAAVRGTELEGRGVLVVEGAHALHLMPEASLDERLFVGCVARPVSFGKVWSFEVERETVRRAFASGLTAERIGARFASMAGTELPQSFAFSLAAWEEEYLSLRLYRGFTLVADERQRPLIERAADLGKIAVERLAPGVFFLAAKTAESAASALAAAGLEVPPLARPAPAVLSVKAGPPARVRIDALRDSVRMANVPAEAPLSPAPRADPDARLAELRASLSSSSRSDEERRELADRIERRLVLTERQIAQSDPRPERLEAGGLDYLGKVRVVERALRVAGDRLEVLYRLPGADPVRALLRPVRLDKNEKGLVLEAEDLVTGSPARVPLGAVSTVRRLRASLFGEDQ
jgi:hypothetical protein